MKLQFILANPSFEKLIRHKLELCHFASSELLFHIQLHFLVAHKSHFQVLIFRNKKILFADKFARFQTMSRKELEELFGDLIHRPEQAKLMTTRKKEALKKLKQINDYRIKNLEKIYCNFQNGRCKRKKNLQSNVQRQSQRKADSNQNFTYTIHQKENIELPVKTFQQDNILFNNKHRSNQLLSKHRIEAQLLELKKPKCNQLSQLRIKKYQVLKSKRNLFFNSKQEKNPFNQIREFRLKHLGNSNNRKKKQRLRVSNQSKPNINNLQIDTKKRINSTSRRFQYQRLAQNYETERKEFLLQNFKNHPYIFQGIKQQDFKHFHQLIRNLNHRHQHLINYENKSVVTQSIKTQRKSIVQNKFYLQHVLNMENLQKHQQLIQLEKENRKSISKVSLKVNNQVIEFGRAKILKLASDSTLSKDPLIKIIQSLYKKGNVFVDKMHQKILINFQKTLKLKAHSFQVKERFEFSYQISKNSILQRFCNVYLIVLKTIRNLAPLYLEQLFEHFFTDLNFISIWLWNNYWKLIPLNNIIISAQKNYSSEHLWQLFLQKAIMVFLEKIDYIKTIKFNELFMMLTGSPYEIIGKDKFNTWQKFRKILKLKKERKLLDEEMILSLYNQNSPDSNDIILDLQRNNNCKQNTIKKTILVYNQSKYHKTIDFENINNYSHMSINFFNPHYFHNNIKLEFENELFFILDSQKERVMTYLFLHPILSVSQRIILKVVSDQKNMEYDCCNPFKLQLKKPTQFCLQYKQRIQNRPQRYLCIYSSKKVEYELTKSNKIK